MVIQYLSIKINIYLIVKQFIYDTKKDILICFEFTWLKSIKLFTWVIFSKSSLLIISARTVDIVADNLSQTHTPYQVLSNGTADDVMSVVTAAKQKQYKVVNDLFTMHCLLKVLWLIF